MILHCCLIKIVPCKTDVFCIGGIPKRNADTIKKNFTILIFR